MVTPNEYAPSWEKADELPIPPFRKVNLAELVHSGVPKPEFIADMLYKGGLHCISGAPDSGKTTLALHWALDVMRSHQPIIFMDEEGGEEIIAEKMIGLGASVMDMEYLTYVPFPGKTWTPEDVLDLMDLMHEIHPVMVLFDSSAAFLARAGLDENNASDCTSFWARVLTPVARRVGAAVLVIDHDTKATEQSRYARGSGAKLAALDVQFKVEIVKPFSRLQSGVLKLHVPKDRRGYLHREWRIAVHSGDGSIKMDFSEATEEEFGDASSIDGSPAKKKIFEQLSGDPKTKQQIVDGIAVKHGHGLYGTTVSTELNNLLREGLADKIDQGFGQPDLWVRAGTSLVVGTSSPMAKAGVSDVDEIPPPDRPMF